MACNCSNLGFGVMESKAHQLHNLGSRINNMMVYTSTSAITGEFARHYYHQSLLKLSSLKMNNLECKPGRRKSSSVVIRAGLLDMLGVSSPQKGNFLQTGMEFAINSFNKGAAVLPKKGEVAYKALVAAVTSFVEPKKEDSASMCTIATNSRSVPILTPKVMGAPKVGLMQPVDPFRQGRMVERGKVYRQTFVIRSYEVGADRTASIDTLTNLFQEVALNHVGLAGIGGNGFGTTRAMSSHNLIWVVNRMHVEVEHYPTWGDVVEIDSWVAGSGKNGMRRDWLVRKCSSGEIVARSTSTWVMMHQITRKFSKMPEDVKGEISPYFLERHAIPEDTPPVTVTKLDDSAEYITSGLSPRRTDLDMNQHVNNVKYINWMMESVPSSILDSHELTSITLQYRRECLASDVVQSLATCPECDDNNNSIHICWPGDEWRYSCAERAVAAAFSSNTRNYSAWFRHENHLHFSHLLRTQKDGAEIVRAKTTWRLKRQAGSHQHTGDRPAGL